MTVCLWTIPLAQPMAVVDEMAVTLDDRERLAAAERSRPDARTRYVVAHGAVRDVLGTVLDRAPDRLRIDRRCRHCGDAAHGKPFVSGGPSFSLSHSGDVAVLAVSTAGDVGVDVETRRPRARLDRLAARVLAEDELERWRATPPAGRLGAFLRAWTAKEAYLKAIGRGLTRPLRDIPLAPDGWTMSAYEPAATAVATLALKGTARDEPQLATWSPRSGVRLP